MKKVLSTLRVGDLVQGKVHEALDQSEFILAFDGDLVRVHNETRRALQVGDIVTVLVRGVNPLRFQLPGPARRHGHLDVSI